MTRSVLLSIVSILVLGCGGPSSSGTPAAPVPSPSLDVPPLDASAPLTEKARPPKLDATCTTNDDCEAAFTGDDCCPVCAPRIANKTWKKDIEAYCAKDENRGAVCPPMGCSWGFSKPKCEKGLCR